MKPWLSLVVVFMIAAHAPAKEKPAPPALPPVGAKTFTLPNGLTIIVDEDRSAPVASVQAWCASGSIHEGKWLGAGLSHILEHMLFKGTTSRKAGEIARQIQDQGGYINAYTTLDRTVYWIDVPSSGATEAIAILADAVLNSTLPEEEYTKEQEVIRREFAMGFDDPERQSSQLMLETVFSESPLRHPVIGYLDVYNKLTRDDVMAYYKERYVPNNLTFVITGDVDADKVHEQLAGLFKDVPRRALEPVLVTAEPVQVGRREAHEEFATELTRLSLAWRIPAVTHPDTPALEVLGHILGAGKSSILNREIREKQRLVHRIAAGMYALHPDGVFVVSALCDPDKRDQVEREALAAIDRIKTNGVTDAELDRARKSMLSAQLSTLGTARGKAADLGSNWLMARNLNFSQDYLDAIARVIADDVRRVAREYLTEGKLNVSSLNPPGSTAADEVANDDGPARGPVEKFVLPNGLRLLVCRDPRLPLVSIYAGFRSGLLAENPKNNGITRLLSRALLKGTTTRSAEEIAESIEGVGGRIAADSGNNSFAVTTSVMKGDLALALDVVADVLTNPAFPAEEVELERAAQVAAIKAEDEQITAVARNVAREKLFGDHPYALRASGRTDTVATITRDDLVAFHKEAATARNGVVAVFGDVDPAQVRALAEKAFAKMPEGRLLLTDAPLPHPLKEEVNITEHRDKQQAVVMVGYPGADVLSKDRVALELIEEASNDLGSRFFNRIREKLGLAYFVGAGNFLGLVPGSFLFYLGTDPLKVDKVTSEFTDEIQKLAEGGLTDEELTRAKKKLLGAEAIRTQSTPEFAARTAVDELVGLGYDRAAGRRAEVEAVTLEDVRRVAAKYFNQPGRVLAVVTPATNSATN